MRHPLPLLVFSRTDHAGIDSSPKMFSQGWFSKQGEARTLTDTLLSAIEPL